MAKSRQSRETAKAFVSPLFAWSNAVLKGGELMLDSIQAATRNADRTIRVAVLPEAETPQRRSAPGKSKTRSKKAKGRRRR